MGSPAIESLQFINISEANVLTSLDPNKALGIDGIGPKILKDAVNLYFNCSVTSLT